MERYNALPYSKHRAARVGAGVLLASSALLTAGCGNEQAGDMCGGTYEMHDYDNVGWLVPYRSERVQMSGFNGSDGRIDQVIIIGGEGVATYYRQDFSEGKTAAYPNPESPKLEIVADDHTITVDCV